MNLKLSLSIVVLATLAGSVLAQDTKTDPDKEEIKVSSKAPDFTVTGIDGKPVKLSEKLKQKKNIVLMFDRAFW